MISLHKVVASITLFIIVTRCDTGTDDSSSVTYVQFNIQEVLNSIQKQLNYEISARLKFDEYITEMHRLYRTMSSELEKLSNENIQLKQELAHVINKSVDAEIYAREMQNNLDTMENQIQLLNDAMSPFLTNKSHYQTQKPRDCQEILKSLPTSRSGVYEIYPEGTVRYSVFCDMTTQGGGWTVIQRRFNGALDFDKTWQEYKDGFGDLTGEHWLGNNMLHILTKSSKTLLVRVLGTDSGSVWKYAQYSDFRVSDESTKYTLTFRQGSYAGNAGDGLDSDNRRYNHNNMMFSTKDRDNDRNVGSCAKNHGGWWFNRCYGSLLNGDYLKQNYWIYTSFRFKSSWMMVR